MSPILISLDTTNPLLKCKKTWLKVSLIRKLNNFSKLPCSDRNIICINVCLLSFIANILGEHKIDRANHHIPFVSSFLSFAGGRFVNKTAIVSAWGYNDIWVAFFSTFLAVLIEEWCRFLWAPTKALITSI